MTLKTKTGDELTARGAGQQFSVTRDSSGSTPIAQPIKHPPHFNVKLEVRMLTEITTTSEL